MKLRSNLRAALLVATAAVLTACATSTPYQPASKPGGFDGFSQTMIQNDRARISFGGNSLTNRDTVENYLLYRAAELAVEKGFDTFTLNARDVEEKTRLTSTGSSLSAGFGNAYYDPFFGYSFYRPRYGWSSPYRYSRFDGFRNRRGFGRSRFYTGFNDPFFNDFDVREITKYRATAEVQFGRGLSASKLSGPNTFNAREVLENLSSEITYPDE